MFWSYVSQNNQILKHETPAATWTNRTTAGDCRNCTWHLTTLGAYFQNSKAEKPWRDENLHKLNWFQKWPRPEVNPYLSSPLYQQQSVCTNTVQNDLTKSHDPENTELSLGLRQVSRSDPHVQMGWSLGWKRIFMGFVTSRVWRLCSLEVMYWYW